MQLTTKQQEVLSLVEAFLKSDSSVFILKGYAGTGKTTMVKQIADLALQKDIVVLMAPTGRAARVLGKKTGYEASTIHRCIYDSAHIKLKPASNIAETQFKLIFPIVAMTNKVVAIVDESSMVSSKTMEQELFQFGTDNLLNDLMTFVRPSFAGKVIFVGDPAQLPPVGDSKSQALNADYFRNLGLKVEETELTEVLRQDSDSMILKNAMQIRDLLKEAKRNHLVFEERKGEVESVPVGEIIDRYMAIGKEASDGKSVIIAYSNRKVSEYNKEIRERKFGGSVPLQNNEPLMVLRNNYHVNLMNGDFTRVVRLGNVVQQSAPVYVQKGGKKERVIITIDFIDAVVIDGKGDTILCYLILNLLDNDQPCLSIDEQRALYINFCIRHPELKQGSLEFQNELIADPYYNALQVKYGYAVTGHKCQGGEWEYAFVDYDGRTGLSDDCLRWSYTATTRAQKTLFVANLPHITPFSKFRIDDITMMKKISPDFRVFGTLEASPFHKDTDPDFLRAKYQCIKHNMDYSPYQIISVTSKPYREIYEIQTPDSVERYDLMYKGGGVFLPSTGTATTSHTVMIKMMLDDERAMPVVCHYVPSEESFIKLYTYIRSACDEMDIKILNVIERKSEYYVDYYFSTSGTTSCLKVYINADGFITYAKPMSFLGKEDEQFVRLIDILHR